MASEFIDIAANASKRLDMQLFPECSDPSILMGSMVHAHQLERPP